MKLDIKWEENTKSSAIYNLKFNVENIIDLCAPEKVGRITEIIKQDNIKIIIRNESQVNWNFNFRCIVENKEIILPIKGLEYLWCLAYSTPIIETEITKLFDNKKPMLIDFSKHPSFDAPLKLLEWSISNLNSTEETSWPVHLPKPLVENGKNYIHLANDLFSLSLSWIILHEIGHIKFNHSTGIQDEKGYLKEELEADGFANSWLINEITDDKYQLKRKLGIGIANLAIFTYHIEKLIVKQRGYPPSIKRLDVNIKYKDVKLGEYHEYCCQILVYIVTMYIDRKKIPLKSREFDRPSEVLLLYYKDIRNYIIKRNLKIFFLRIIKSIRSWCIFACFKGKVN